VAAPRVTVVVVTRDRAPELGRSLPHHADLPVIVIDNDSSDDSAAVARASGARVEQLRHNAGAAGRNLGVELARTPYVAFADDDSWWAPGALDRAVAILDLHPELALVAARVLVGEQGRTDAVCQAMSVSPLPPTAAGPQVLGFLACGAVVRRDAFLQVGGFSSRYETGGEEGLLALDLAAAGYQLAYAHDVVAHHHPSSRRRSSHRRVVEARNALWTVWLRRPVVSGLAAAARATRTSDGRAGLLAALSGLRWVVADRRRLPPDVEELAARLARQY
jgi:N-acetylglucosaminyl-diphospho-decaprenol L-rhamnosyltransferase